MKIQWALMAEGITQDARGAVTAVGLAQAVLVVPAVPVQAKRAIVLLLSGESGEFIPGKPLRFRMSVTGPSDEDIARNEGGIPLASSLYPVELPGSAVIASETIFQVKEYGRHSVKLAVQIADQPELAAEVDFFVLRPSAITSEDSNSVSAGLPQVSAGEGSQPK
jgi:hypothetical protein